MPVCFVLVGDCVYQAIDAKPKSVAPGRLRRVKNIRANPKAALLVDQYLEDWRRLWWVLLQGRARLLTQGSEQQRASAGGHRSSPIALAPIADAGHAGSQQH